MSGDETPKRLSQVKRQTNQERKPLIQVDPPADTTEQKEEKKNLKQDALLALQGLQGQGNSQQQGDFQSERQENPTPVAKEKKDIAAKEKRDTAAKEPLEQQNFKSPDFQELESLFKTMNSKFYYCGFVYKLNLLGASGKTLFADNLTGQVGDKNAFWSKWWMELWGPVLNLWKVPDELGKDIHIWIKKKNC